MVSGLIAFTDEDQEFASRLTGSLARAGLHMRRSIEPVIGSAAARQEMLRQIEAADLLVLLVSPHSLDSHWVTCEVGAALAARKPVIPILLSDCEPSSGWLALFDRADVVMRGYAGHDQVAAAVLQRTRSALPAADRKAHDRDDARLAANAILAEGTFHSLGDVTVLDLLEEGRRA